MTKGSRGTITTPTIGDSLDVQLLVDYYSKDGQITCTKSNDALEVEFVSQNGDVVKGVANIARHLVVTSASDPHSALSVWTRKTLNVANVFGCAEELNHHLQLRTFVSGHYISIADIVVRDNLKGSPNWAKVSAGKTTPHLLRWITHVDSLMGISQTAKVVRAKGRGGHYFNYDKHQLVGATDGNVVTRFPPEPSGYLHIGHIKAAMLNSFYAEKYNGRLLLRFDDTNPAKERDDFVDNIMHDLASIGITFHSVSHTSDYFEIIAQYAIQLLKSGKAFIDDTPLEQMREERLGDGMRGFESRCRNRSVEENLYLFEEMRAGSPTGSKCVMRAKIDMGNCNAVLRDPSLFRCNSTPHFRTGTKYKAYPLYDFACPIVDSIEGVTHALRSSEYHDRNSLYYWVLDALNLRKPVIEDFSRLSFKFVPLSKRYLKRFVDNKWVSGWDDPRFPTVQGILRRGMTVEALREFILIQGASKSLNLMDMDKLWALNRLIIADIVPRYTVLDPQRVRLTLTNVSSEPTVKSVPLFKKNESLGNKDVTYCNKVFIDLNDANLLHDNEEITLLNWGNVVITKIIRDGNVIALEGELNQSTKGKKKLIWLADVPDVVPLVLRKYGFLITTDKLGLNETLEECINTNSLSETTTYGEPSMRTLKKGDKLQADRKSYYIVDSPFTTQTPLILTLIPDGTKAQ